MLTASSLIMLPTAIALGGIPPLPQGQTFAALLYLALIASALAYRLFYTILQQAGAGNLGLVTLLITPFAIIFGALLFDETLPPQAFAGVALLTLGMVVLDGRPLHYLAKRFSA